MFRTTSIKRITTLLLALMLIICAVACGKADDTEYIYIDELVGTEFDMVPLGAAPISKTLMPVASGTDVRKNDKVEIDASNVNDGYVMIKYVEKTSAKLKCIITCPSGAKYTYNLSNTGNYEVFPFSDSKNGTYKIGVYKNVTDNKYAVSFTTDIAVNLKDEYGPFLYPNQYVNYKADSAIVAKASELCKDCTTELDSINAIYRFVVENFTYDNELAATVTSGYLPDVDKVLEKKSGICFDYAAVMTAMLRSQGIPCQLVIGYAGDVYHAWINAYSKSEGWLNGAIFFDGQNWKLMDPTYASTGGETAEIMNYIGNGSNYNSMYIY